MTWSTAPAPPVRKYGPAWTTTAAPPVRRHGPAWFTHLEQVVPLSAEGILSVSMFGGAPRLIEFAAHGALAAVVAPIKTNAAAFGAAGRLTATMFQTQAVTAAFSGSTDGMRCSVNDGLWAIIVGGAVITDGLSATIRGGTFDGLRAAVYPIMDGLYAEVVKL